MKFYYRTLFLILALSNVFFCLKIKHSEKPVISSTPKARQLRDHFGVSKSKNNYGPPPSLNLDNLLIHNSDFSWTKIPNPAFANELISPDGKKCDITRHAYYDICYAAQNCAECSAIESCGIFFIYTNYLSILDFCKSFFSKTFKNEMHCVKRCFEVI